ncbi:hypothetical protein ACJMK2_025574 [Sinanodonta woodiana]|uniref:Ig-like domain-containing protein n=1 Tax=Sinanodonta woodiana TaxID=1069815 RepID=A0ABD3XHG3_SINWO
MITTTTATTPLGTTTPPTTTTFPTTKTTISTTPTTTTPATHPTPKQTLPVVHVNHVYYAKYGETLSIACSVTGNPVPSVHWKKLGVNNKHFIRDLRRFNLMYTYSVKRMLPGLFFRKIYLF